jgi:hypothetical protein
MLKRLSFHQHVFGNFVENLLAVNTWIYFWVLNSMLSGYMPVFLCQHHAVFVTIPLYYDLNSGIVMPPTSFFLLNIALAIQGLLCFHMKCRIFFPSSVNNVIVVLMGIASNLGITSPHP